MVVAKSTAARNGNFVETIGTYNPVVKPTHLQVNEERALYWLMQGAQPSETSAYLLNKIGVLDRYFEQRPAAKANFKFLDKRTAAISVPSVIEQPSAKAAEPEPEPEPEPAAPEEVVEEVPVAGDGEEPVVAEADAAPTEDTSEEA